MKNKVAIVLKSIAWWTFGLGFIMGFFASSVEVPSFTSNFEYVTYTEFSLTILLAIWGSSFVSGMLFLGFAEIIELLQQLVNRSISKEQLEVIKIDEEEYKKEKLYKELIGKKSILTSITELNYLKSQFETIIDFRDTRTHLDDINKRIDNIQKDIIMKQENKDRENKLSIEKKEKRTKFFKRNYKKMFLLLSTVLIIITFIIYQFSSYQNNLTEAKKTWSGRWTSYGGYSNSGLLDISFDESLISICTTDICKYDIKVNFDISRKEVLTFRIDSVTYELILKTDNISNLKYNGTEKLFKRIITRNK